MGGDPSARGGDHGAVPQGTHAPGWLARVSSVRLFVSAVRLRLQKKWPRATTRWALDSGGFSELSLRGAWSISPRQYADEVRRAMDEIGGLDFAAVQDWMCEPFVLAKTGLSVAEPAPAGPTHQMSLAGVA